MRKLLRKYFIPHEVNAFHPHAVRSHSIVYYALVFLCANYIIFPLLGLNNTRTSAATIDATQLIELANADRKENGLSTLTNNEKLSEAAKRKGEDMLSKGYWDHFGPNGETPWQFMKQSGYSFIYAGENLAKNFETGPQAHTAWMNSKTHRANILSENFTEIGIAVVTGNLGDSGKTRLIIAMFGTPASTALTTSNQTVPEVPQLKAPVLEAPKNGEVLSSNTVVIQGTASSGNIVKVYSDNTLIGEILHEGASFSKETTLSGNQANLAVSSYDSKTRRESPRSNTVSITIDPSLYTQVLGIAKSSEDISPASFSFSSLNFAQRFDLLFVAVLAIIILVDAVIVIRKTLQHKRYSSYHGFNIGLVLILVVGAVSSLL